MARRPHCPLTGDLFDWQPPQVAVGYSADVAGRGMRNRAIAEMMNATEGAIKVSLHRIYGKLGIENRTELARLVQQQPE